MPDGCLERVGPRLLGIVFAVVGVRALLTVPTHPDPAVPGVVSVLALVTAGMVTFGFRTRRRAVAWTVAWVLSLAAFFVVAWLSTRG